MPYVEHFIIEATRFGAFAFVCGCLLQPRFTRRGTLLLSGGFLLGILAAQAGLFLAGCGGTLVLTLLPVTAYVPAIVGVHVLSRSGFPQTASIWSAGLLVSFTLLFFQKLLGTAFVHTAVAVFLAAAGLSALVFFLLRRPFRAIFLENQSGWLLLSFPTVMLFLLFSYWTNTVTDPVFLLFILLLALSVIGVMVWALFSVASLRQMEKNQQAVRTQLEVQRREYEELRRKIEKGRRYRHDMRHHLRVLEGLFDQAKSAEGLRYLSALNGQLTELEEENCCENATVDAVLRSYVGRAREEDCLVTVKADVPTACPVDEIDLCVLLANGVENAINACRSSSRERERWIRVSVVANANGNLAVKIENTCDGPVRFGRDGLPESQAGEQHGIGLKSVDAVVRKYDGVLQCEEKEGVFTLRAVLFPPLDTPPGGKGKPKRRALYALLTVLLGLALVNCAPEMARALEGVPVLGAVVRLAEVRTYGLGWGDTFFTAEVPVAEDAPASSGSTAQGQTGQWAAPFPGGAAWATPRPTASPGPTPAPEASPSPWGTEWDGGDSLLGAEPSRPVERDPAPSPGEEAGSPADGEPPSYTEPDLPTPSAPAQGAEDLNQQMREYIARVRETFLWYVARKYQGYVASDTGYQVLRDDEEMLSLCFYTTLNAGGSGEYSRCFTLYKPTGQVLELKDLFLEGGDYVGAVSADILGQMTRQVQAGEGDYFIPGGIWSEEECFQAIDPDQNFYLDEDNELVIIFDEYEVAPGSMGMPRFVVNRRSIQGLLAPWLRNIQVQ